MIFRNYAYVDGSFNPQTNVYGAGGFLVDQYGRRVIFKTKGFNKDLAKMRNVAGEMLGVRKVIRLAKERNMKKLKIFHDYEGVANWVNGLWKPQNKYTKAYKTFVEKMGRSIDISFEHVKGHSGVAGNVLADKLAREAVGIFRKGGK